MDDEVAMGFDGFWNDGRAERRFTASGLDCCTKTHPLGHRCGYVSVADGHPLYGLDCDEVYCAVPGLNVDGGVTFAYGLGGSWVFGWDAAHPWHRRDWSIASDSIKRSMESHPALRTIFDHPDGSYMVDADMAEMETRRFAEQLASAGGESA